MVNIPKLQGSKFLIAGAGGGFDIFGGIPLASALIESTDIVLASFSLKSQGFKIRKSTKEDYPEGELAVEIPVYTFGKNGVQNLRDAYEEVIRTHNIDTVILVDGGVDSLMVGDEENAGTILEDFISLAAVDQLNVPNKYLVCVGFGTEVEENLNHYRVLENIAALSKSGGFLGSCSLTRGDICYWNYDTCCKLAWINGRKSHIHTRIIPAVEGDFGYKSIECDAQVTNASKEPVFVSPLSSIYWFFNLPEVVKRNLMIPKIAMSRTFTDAMMLFRQNMIKPTRSKEHIPL